jgi:hypothetical protein
VDPIRAADFQTRSLLLALRCGEPSQIATSLAFEAMHTAAQGIQTQQRVERLLEKAETLAREVKDPAVSGLIAMARGVAGNMYGCWKRGVEYSGQAERIFRERCTGVAFEINTAQGFALWALNFAGEVGELAHRIPPYLAEAEKQGNISASAHASTLVLPALAADNPSGAERELRRWADYLHQNFSQHYNAFCAQIQIDLYRGDAATAWKHFQERWPAIKSSLLLRTQLGRILAYYTRARCVLIRAASDAEPATLLGPAEKDARRIAREGADWAVPLAEMIRAGIASLVARTMPAHSGAAERAISLLDAAISGFETHDMPIFAAAARRRLGKLLGGEAGQTLIDQSEAWMAAQKIVNPDRITTMLAPGVE